MFSRHALGCSGGSGVCRLGKSQIGFRGGKLSPDGSGITKGLPISTAFQVEPAQRDQCGATDDRPFDER